MPQETTYIPDGGVVAHIPTGTETAYIADGAETAFVGLPGPGLVVADLVAYTVAQLDFTINQMDDLA